MYSDITVKNLLDGRIEDRYSDKVFWYASKVNIIDNKVKVFIENNNLVTFDNVDLNMCKISELRDKKQKDINDMENVLISSGSFLFINKKLLVTQRQETTEFDPGFWTAPAGRCDRIIFDTGIKETIEEIEIKRNGQILYPLVSKPFLGGKKNILFYDTSYYHKFIKLKTYEICLYLDNVLIEECKAWMYFSEEVNTIEFRIPLFTTLNEKELTFSNPEFDTDTELKNLDDLQKLDLVPALEQLIKEIDNER